MTRLKFIGRTLKMHAGARAYLRDTKVRNVTSKLVFYT